MSDPNTLLAAISSIAGTRAAAVRLSDGRASLILDVTGLSGDERSKMEAAIKAALMAEDGVSEVRIAMTSEKRGRRLIAVGSGKGGVGKSTVSANLAIALKRLGFKVGLIDADIYGPSQPRLMSTEGQRPEAQDQKMIPIMSPYGIPMLSMGHLVKPGQAIAWRGPMAGNALGQLIDADWGDVELIIADLPPGTGDVQLSMISKQKPAGAVIVSTPQDLSLIDATRAIDLFNQSGVPIIGLIENMAGYACPHCGEISDPFGSGGVQAAANVMGHDFLGRIPLTLEIRTASDAGQPPAAEDGPAATPFHAIAAKIKDWLAQ
ncbi:ATP-binding protein involved in chromosome partitioning [Sphingobium boeckii]|uniref:Iron-sulfur cluster carrier protein n=2 Tax=Sphingobium boeckii TaxID=1082345 RepID=A0A7W9AF33_9SPHN|nr:ATP-binding protein involved in chromosome partitioning [Sphingobium boeckii]